MASSADEDEKVDYDDFHEENGHERNLDEDELLRDGDGDAEMTSPDKKLPESSSNEATTSSGNFETLEAIKARVREMEEEAQRLREMQNEVIGQSAAASALQQQSTSPHMSIEEKVELDGRSVYVGNVDYGATAEELEQHFHGCGSVNRVTILCNKFDGHPKGFAYVEFADPESVNTAMAMDESLFRGRLIKVMPKRTNRPGMTERGFGRGRAGFRGGFRGGRGGFRGGYSRFPRRGYRGRAAYFSPY
jgi:polyadenylate-binding protein 2